MGVPVVYRKASEAAIASYDGYDLAAGIGYKRFYACATGLSGSTTYNLSTQQVDSSKTRTSQECSGSSIYIKEVDLDFDLPFTNPATVKGTALIQMTIGMKAQTSSVGWMFPGVALKKVDNSNVETSLGYLSGSPIYFNDLTRDYRYTVPLTLVKTHFGKDEKLRLTGEIWTKITGHTEWLINLYFDGSNRAASLSGDGIFTNHDTNLTVDMPFVVDI